MTSVAPCDKHPPSWIKADGQCYVCWCEHEIVKLRRALEPFAGAEFRVWKGTSYGDACRQAARMLDGRDGWTLR